MAEHAREPWRIEENEGDLFIEEADGSWICEVFRSDPPEPKRTIATAYRIVACVNALAGRDPEKLEALVEALLFWRAYATSNEAAVRLDAALAAFLGEGDES